MTAQMPDDVRRLAGWLEGPASPDLGCEECFDVLDAYVELELAGADAVAAVHGMAAHLTSCPACRDDHDSLCALLLADQMAGRD